MESSTEKLLPIGTVVKVKSLKKPVMIYGRFQIQKRTENVYDYLAVPYPEGNISEEFNVFFNRNLIEEVLYLGFQSPQEDGMNEKVEKDLKEYREKEENTID
ncbi:DUF4176 domain-containing protein [Bacillus carboniphilus]|uniref:DUF4176 domain-containing protein n=1 Tax=Bacillus carboniphilus TaxID=86663 RepID=A0ABY9JSN6_9BACI|nr:DUF4176 domain-containing protein [Bacillus carboniphilus]WLR41402.1 DUF4176 domain-containing protein [Bacillus carboniphilus]